MGVAFRRSLFAPLFGFIAVVLTIGCGTGGTPASPTTTTTQTQSGPDVTGNWKLTTSATQGGSLFPFLSGYLQSGTNGLNTAELTESSTTGCFAGQNAISAAISVNSTALKLSSLSINGQYLNISATLDGSGSSMTGNYQIAGGCADGASGTIVGTRYAALSGTYSGSIDGTSPVKTIQLNLSQNNQGNGNGDFLVSGNAVLTGVACLTSGTAEFPNAFVSGDFAKLTFTTNDPAGAELTLTGSFNAPANTLQVSTIEVSGGACAGSYGTATLSR